MKADIITLLRQRGTYVSGQELCERYGVSRTAVWKAMEQLKKDGYQIEAVKNRGYLLREDARGVFGRTEIESRRKSKWVGQTLVFYDQTDSTNMQAKRLAEEGAPDGTVVVADCQSAGRGRRGRAWTSPPGTNLYFTLLLRPRITPDKASMLTLVMALAVAKGIHKTLQPCVQCQAKDTAGKPASEKHGADATAVGIKWPNDIVIDGRKVCGILTELSLSVEQDCIDYLVIGTGINVARQSFPEELAGHAISLEEIYGSVNRSELLANVLEAFEEVYGQFLRTQSLEYLRPAYDALLVSKDKSVRVLDPKGEYDGIARGIQNTGELIVELPDGSVKNVYAGEVSVRGIYGYV
ncbi:MAG: biotin--[acetyl-CoA-carboxylase] ligase [Acetatifactor sp.]|nr:biotin--[acetyl-CoA-carboxylase] ligase [Acetatifactor sp.]